MYNYNFNTHKGIVILYSYCSYVLWYLKFNKTLVKWSPVSFLIFQFPVLMVPLMKNLSATTSHSISAPPLVKEVAYYCVVTGPHLIRVLRSPDIRRLPWLTKHPTWHNGRLFTLTHSWGWSMKECQYRWVGTQYSIVWLVKFLNLSIPKHELFLHILLQGKV